MMPPGQMPPSNPMPAQPMNQQRDVKVTKTDAAYGEAYQPGQNCGACIHFDGQGTCEIVEGPIDPEMVSDFFEPAAQPMGPLP